MEASVIHAPAGSRRTGTGGLLLRMRTDDQLVALHRMGYDEAFSVIHDRYRARILAYVRRMLARSGADAEDVLQDVLLRAYSALREDDRPVTLRAWLYRVAHNRCVDVLRRPEPPMAEIFERQRRPPQDPPAETERRESLRRLVGDVQRLPEQQRSALLMRELEGLSYNELADALGLTVAAVKSLLVRARCGLVEAGEARDAACADIRSELDDAAARGVRANARSRRHMRDCEPCRDYRRVARGRAAGLRGFVPGGSPLTALAKLLGLGGAGSAAGAGAGAGGSAAVIGTGAAATATKVVAVVCCAAMVGGGAAELRTERAPRAPAHRHVPAPAARAVAPAGPAPRVLAPAQIAADPFRTHEGAAAAPAKTPAPTRDPAPSPEASPTPPAAEVAPIRATAPASAPATADAPAAPSPQDAADQSTAAQTGGALAPVEDAPATPTPGPSAAPAPDAGTATG